MCYVVFAFTNNNKKIELEKHSLTEKELKLFPRWYVTVELIGAMLTTVKLDLNMKCKLVNVCSLFSIPGPELLSHSGPAII